MRLRAMKRHRKELEETVVARTEELHKKNSMLEERQEEISLQNEELEKHRNHLEELVEIRTEELKKAKLKAEEADRLKSSFLANMSHEIRTPMNAIIGFSSLLHDDLAKPEEKQMYVALILSNGETLLNLLNDIIDISLLESEQLKIHKDETNISKLVYEIFVAFNNCVQIRERPKLAIILENNDIKPLIVKTDYTRLLQILNNIIGNAIKYTTEGTIKISYKQKNQMVEFAIADTGIGITEDAIQAVFDRFHKIENKETSFYRGGGLGLSISKSLVELLGGSIWVESKPGKGSTFYFTIATK